MHLSIRWRLTLWNTLALGVLLLGFAALVYALMAHALYEQIDNTLVLGYRQMERDERLTNDTGGRLSYWATELKEHNNVFCIVYGPDGKVFARTEELAADSVPSVPQSPTGEPRLRDVTVPFLGRQRALEGRLPMSGGQEWTVLLLASLEGLDHELGMTRRSMLTAIPLALAVAAGIAYFLARKALAPVDQLRRSTREITADRLDRRLPVVNSRDELGSLAQTINEMIGRLERSFSEVRRFTADASHELRTPLTAIRTEAEVALTQWVLPAAQQQLLASILEECERLTRLTDQLLTLSREDAGVAHLESEPVDLSDLMSRVAETMRPVAEARGVELHVESESVSVRGDGARLRQVLFNLLDNAIKYTPSGGRIDLRVERHGEAAVLTVRDTGIGIPPEHLSRVFDRFYRVDKARSREQGGTGLGLSISRSIVAAHGGSIDLASAPSQGTTCTVSLPLG